MSQPLVTRAWRAADHHRPVGDGASGHRRVRKLRRFCEPLRRAILGELAGEPETLIADSTLLSVLHPEFRENMVVSVEFYAGKVGEQDGVKLEDEVLITADGPVMLSLYPYEEKLL